MSFGSVQTIARYRMADTRQVGANLVGPAGADPYCEQGEVVESAQNTILAPGAPPSGEFRGHPHAARRIAGDRLVYSAVIGLQRPLDQCDVNLGDPPVGELRRKVAMRGVVF